jgi:hypothetical protein
MPKGSSRVPRRETAKDIIKTHRPHLTHLVESPRIHFRPLVSPGLIVRLLSPSELYLIL